MASVAFLEKAYLAYFGRPVDTTALIDYANTSEAVVMSNFSSSPESKALYPTFGLLQINAIYNMLFGRNAELEGGAYYWLDQLATGKVNQANVAVKILEGALGGDITAVNNKLNASHAFTLALDTTAEALGYAGNASAATARAFLSTIAGTAATQDAINTAVINAVGSTNASQSLTTGQDNIIGSPAADVFTANIFDNSNTLQSGDKITGGAGVDRLNADIGNSQKFAITPETTGVEQVAIRAQAVAVDSANNNLQNAVQIDAQRMVGVTQWESNNSRADLLIEDVRILPTQITKDITIAMVETDPGHVDMGVYFDQYSLRSAPAITSGAVLRLQLMDTRSSDAGTAKLLNNPYNGFTFKLDAVTIAVSSAAIDAAQTYAELQVAVAAAVKAVPALAAFTVTLGNNFTAIDTISGKAQTGQEIVLTNTGAGVVTTDATTGWTAAGVVPSSSGLHTFVTSAPADVAVFKVTSTVILDDVGRGSTAGDLVIGGLSVGDTSSSKGVERFEIEVRDNSKLESIRSTNNTLQEVTIKNGMTTSSSYAYVGTVANAGALTVNGNSGTNGGNVANSGATDAQTGINAPLPGTTVASGTHGFSDVRLIDASAMTGNLAFTAEITSASIAKYMNLIDTQAAPAPDAVNGNGAIANFVYTGGAGKDTLVVDIDAAVAASRSSLISGREDFTFAIDGGAGNDAITVTMVNALNSGAAQNWYNNQDLNNNFTVNGGTGDDTIRTPGAGDMKIDGGAGDDTIYTENTGAMAQWVFNTTDQVTALAGARNINDLRSGLNDSYSLFNTKLSVTFLGIPNTVVVNLANTASYKATDLEINQAIKMAINTDPVLSKLLVAQDGPANTLVVKALVDGIMSPAFTPADLVVSLVTPALGTLSAAEIVAAGVAYLPAGTVATDALVIAAMVASATAFGTKGDYTPALANDGLVNLAGTNGFATSDNLVTGGAGNDVIVLGSTEGATASASSNDTLVFGASFGNDTVVNFTAAGFGADHMDFVGIGGTAIGAVTADKSIVIGTVALTVTTATPTTPAVSVLTKVQDLFAADNLVAQTHVYVDVSAHNVGTVYEVTDAVGAKTATAVIMGTIDLADTLWSTLTSANFVNSGSTTAAINAYMLQEGPTGAVAPVVIVVPPVVVVTKTAVSVVSPGGTVSALNGDFQFNVALGNTYVQTISGFSTNDVLNLAGASVSVTPDASDVDGSQSLTAVTTAGTVTITLTGLTNAQDAGLFNTGSFATVFGAGSLIV